MTSQRVTSEKNYEYVVDHVAQKAVEAIEALYRDIESGEPVEFDDVTDTIADVVDDWWRKRDIEIESMRGIVRYTDNRKGVSRVDVHARHVAQNNPKDTSIEVRPEDILERMAFHSFEYDVIQHVATEYGQRVRGAASK